MNSRGIARFVLACGVSFGAMVTPALAQDAPDITSPNKPGAESDSAIIVTGSRIKQDPTKSALPLQVITTVDIERNGLSNPEALNMFLTTSGTGADNLASNSDVTTGAQRGTNGLSAANLRGQGSAATLVLLNGRRVAAHGLSGGAVDVNQIPFAAIDRVEILKDGASAIYGTDAIGGVINYITKNDFQGLSLSGMSDFTEQGGGNIYRLSGLWGAGDLADNGFNVTIGVSYQWNQILRGSDRDFVNGNQPSRGLSVDTRGTPIATLFNTGANAFQAPSGSLLAGVTLPTPGGANAASGGVNILDLPGGAGCETMDGGMAYDNELWNNAAAYYACAWDTGRAAVIQQPLRTLTYYGKGTYQLGASQVSLEVTGSDAHSAKSFSNAQISGNTTSTPVYYPLNALTKSTYDQVFNALVAAFPTAATTLNSRYGLPLGFRWRCMACGPREYVTDTKTLRAYLALEGPLPLEGWDYRIGASYARSESSSVLGSGYYYRGTLSGTGVNGKPDPAAPIAPGATVPGIIGLINAGILNPFSLTQTATALSGLDAVSAEGVTLYGGRYIVKEADASISGPLFALPGGDVQIAAGVDYRREIYEFNGSAAAAANQPVIFLAAFDNVNALTPKHRDVKAAYAEINLPIFDMLTVSGAFRIDDYTGF
ncbi:TonB-dependent receptor, partial [Novosphingobium sp.]|uniref:TonB-dependent receptor n=1 Tax=Novosphingobium sp. TaxID=1874826 RepID=UPI0035B2CBD4